MEFYFRFTAGLLLLVQSFHLASLQFSTDSPGPTIDKSWLRDVSKLKAESQNTALPREEYDQRADETDGESNNDPNDPVASGSMAFSGEKDNGNEDSDANQVSDDTVTTTVSYVAPNATAMQPQSPDDNASPSVDNTNSSLTNMTDQQQDFLNSTTPHPNSTSNPSLQNSTRVSGSSNNTDLQTTTSTPEGNATEESTSKPQEGTELTNATEHSNTTASTASPEMNETTTTSATTTVFESATTKSITVMTSTTADLNTPERSNRTDTGSEEESSGDRGLESDPHRSSKKGAWGAVLGMAVAVAFVGLVAYFILKKKHKKIFSHRKLVEEYPADPVLRLDNGEPLDFSFGGSAYYNPALQGDNIQMSNFPGHH
ncbi:uncharacterized protein V6R79_024588 [Siganus canaliculatus]